jgi:hypothetical protein
MSHSSGVFRDLPRPGSIDAISGRDLAAPARLAGPAFASINIVKITGDEGFW